MALPPSLLIVDLGVTAISFFITVLCFPIQPAIALTLMLVAYAAALTLRLRRDRE